MLVAKLALDPQAQRRAVRLLKAAEPLLLDVRVVPDVLQYYALRSAVEDLDVEPAFRSSQAPTRAWASNSSSP